MNSTLQKAVFILLVFVTFEHSAQVGIGIAQPKSSLDIPASNINNPSNTDGILIPRVNAFPSIDPEREQNGMMIFLQQAVGLNNIGFYYWDWPNTTWVPIGAEEWKAGTNSDGDNLIYATRSKLAGTDVVITNDGRIGFGTSDPIERFEFRGPGDNDFQITSANTNPPNLILYNTAGTLDNPAPLPLNQEIGSLIVKTYDGVGIREPGSVRFYIDSVAVSAGSVPTRFVVTTTPVGSTSNVERLVIKSNGNTGIGTSTPVSKLDVNGDTYVRGSLGIGIKPAYSLDVNGVGVVRGDFGAFGGAYLFAGVDVTGTAIISTLNAGGAVYSDTNGVLSNTPSGIRTAAIGKVNSAGTAVKVSGATVSRVSVGNYRVVFSTPRDSANYTIQLSVVNCATCSGDNSINIYYEAQDTAGFNVKIGLNDNGSTSHVLSDREFMFTVHDF